MKCMNMTDKLQKAIEIFKAKLTGVHGSFNASASESNSNEVEIYSEEGLYCTINIRSGRIKGI